MEAKHGNNIADVAPLKIDKSSGVQEVISGPHAEIHKGHSFTAGHENLTMADTDVINMAFRTAGGGNYTHMVIGFSTLVAGNLVITEGGTWTQGTGTLLTPYNRWRSSTQTTLLQNNKASAAFVAGQILTDVTGLAGGTALPTRHAFGTKFTSGGQTRDLEELVLKPSTTYHIQFTAVGNSNAGQIMLDYYNHTNAYAH